MVIKLPDCNIIPVRLPTSKPLGFAIEQASNSAHGTGTIRSPATSPQSLVDNMVYRPRGHCGLPLVVPKPPRVATGRLRRCRRSILALGAPHKIKRFRTLTMPVRAALSSFVVHTFKVLPYDFPKIGA